MNRPIMDLTLLRTRYKPDILALAELHKAENIRIFGSIARGEANAGSDIDFLVHFRKGASLFDLAGLGNDLSRLLEAEVDVIPDDAVHWYIRDQVLQEAVPL